MWTKLRLFSVLTLVATLPSFGQTFGGISGEVTDSSGSIVVGAKVTVTNPETNFTRSATSNSAGSYSFPDLVPGRYDVKVETQGFQTQIRTAVQLQVQQAARIDFQLSVGEVTEAVQVSGGAPLLDTENAALGTVIENQRIIDLPLNGRSFVSLISLSPNVTTGQISNSGLASGRSGGDRAEVSLSIAGQRRTYTFFTLDGITNTDVDFNTYAFLPSIDALQEFKVQTGISSAEFGREPAQVNVSTKSGTNDYHGTVFEFLRNNDLDALPFAFTSKVPSSAPFKWNQYGFTLGGPVQIPKVFNGKNRLFFMSNYEGFKLRDQVQQLYSVPSLAMRTGNFSELLATGTVIKDPLDNGAPFAGNIIPAQRLDPTALGLLQFYPAPNIPGAGLVNNYLGLQNNTANKNLFIQRMDFVESDKSTWFGRYNWQNDADLTPGLGQAGNTTTTTVYQAMLSNTRILSPVLVNEFRFGYTGYRDNVLDLLSYKEDVNGMLHIPLYLDPPPIGWGIPNVAIQGYSTLGDSIQGPFQANDKTFEANDSISWTHGKHAIKIGADIRRDRYNDLGNQTTRGNFTIQNQASGYGFSDYMLGYIEQTEDVAGLAATQFRATSQAYFVTDTWRVLPNLTIDAGLRYEYTPPWTSKGDNLVSVVIPNESPADFQPNAPAADTPYLARDCAAYGQSSFYFPQSNVRFPPNVPVSCVSGLGTTLVKSDYTNFAPRLGIAWSPTSKWTIRAGAGIFYAQDIGNLNFDVSRNSAGRYINQADLTTHNLTFANPLGIGGTANACGLPAPEFTCIVGPYAYASDVNRHTPYVEQYVLNIQRQLTSSTVLEIGYVGSQGHHLQRAALYDAGVPGATGSAVSREPFPEYNAIQDNVSTVNSNYNSGTIKLNQRFSKGITALIGYTFAKSLDDGSSIAPENGNFASKPQTGWCLNPCEYALSDFDTRQRFVASVLYELPFGKGQQWVTNGFLSRIVGGWQVNSIVTKSTGFPMNITDGINQANTNVGFDRPNAIAGIAGKLSNPSTGEWFNIDSVQLQPFGAWGNVSRNSETSPGIFSWDFSALKNFNFTERTYLQFRFECFNCANHPNFGYPGLSLAANQVSSQGQAIPGTGTFGEITSTLPGIDMRELQLSLKLVF